MNQVSGANGADHFPQHPPVTTLPLPPADIVTGDDVDDDSNSARDDAMQDALERSARENLRLARQGGTGMFKIYPRSDETVYLMVYASPFLRERDGEFYAGTHSRVYVVSHWVRGECQFFVPPPERGERRAYLPHSVLLGRDIDPSRLPPGLKGEEIDEFLDDADLVSQAARHWDELNQPRGGRRRQRRHD